MKLERNLSVPKPGWSHCSNISSSNSGAPMQQQCSHAWWHDDVLSCCCQHICKRHQFQNICRYHRSPGSHLADCTAASTAASNCCYCAHPLLSKGIVIAATTLNCFRHVSISQKTANKNMFCQHHFGLPDVKSAGLPGF